MFTFEYLFLFSVNESVKNTSFSQWQEVKDEKPGKSEGKGFAIEFSFLFIFLLLDLFFLTSILAIYIS
jgi:hypothetical protein